MASRAVAALDLSGPLALQSNEAARGLRWWAWEVGADLDIVDTGGSSVRTAAAYREWSESSGLIVLGPYGSGHVRRTLAGGIGGLLWNHGGSADDLARPWAPMVPAPASTYLRPLIDHAKETGCTFVTLVRGPGLFAQIVVAGATQHLRKLAISVEIVELANWRPERKEGQVVLAAGRFEDDVDVVARLRQSALPAVVGCLAAGIPEFARRLGPLAEGVIGPTQWWPTAAVPELGPSGAHFADGYRMRFRSEPSYVAAQATAGAYLAEAASELGLESDSLPAWETSTLLGTFRVDGTGRQVGHRISAGRWTDGSFRPIHEWPNG